MLVHVKDHKEFGNKNVFTKLVNELNFLRNEGIIVDLNGSKQIVKCQLVLILGDPVFQILSDPVFQIQSLHPVF